MDYSEYDRLIDVVHKDFNINILDHLQDVNITISFIDRNLLPFSSTLLPDFLLTSFKVFYIFYQ